jgi:nicotinamidase-related amidase
MKVFHPRTLDPAGTALLVVDVQEKFRPALPGFQAMVEGCLRLVHTFRLLGLPIVVTEQYPRGLGRTVTELKAALALAGPPPVPVFEKTAFSSLGCPGAVEWLRLAGSRSVVVCGIEAHVCVQQSVHDLLQGGYSTHVAVDAVESRRAVDRQTALERMSASGAIPATAELVAFELLRDAKHPRFKEVQALYK